MTEIEMMGTMYEYETSIDYKRMTITDPATREWAQWDDEDNIVGDPNFYEDWEDWIYENWDNLEWNKVSDYDDLMEGDLQHE